MAWHWEPAPSSPDLERGRPQPPAGYCRDVEQRHRRPIGLQLGLDFSPTPRTGSPRLIDVRQMLGALDQQETR